MGDDEWDDAKDLAVVNGDNWDDQDVADDWEVEEAEEKAPVVKPAAPKPKPVKPQPVAAKFVDAFENETEMEKKARLERLIRERDLDSAMSLFGFNSSSADDTKRQESSSSSFPAKKERSGTFLDADLPAPQTIAEFDQYARLIIKKLETLEGQKNYPQFLEGLINNLMEKRDVPEIRKVANVLSDMASAKLKEKQAANKPKAAPAISLKVTKPSKGSGKFEDCFAYDDGDGFDD